MVQIHSPRPNFFESATYNFSKSRKSAKSAWYKTKRSLLISARPEGSLSFKFIALHEGASFH